MPYPKGQARDEAWNRASRDKQKGVKRGEMSEAHKKKIAESVKKTIEKKKRGGS